MTFEDYLQGKRIDPSAFQKAEPVRYADWKVSYDQMHVNSFTLQKLNLLNALRRKYLWKVEATVPTLPEGKPRMIKPKMN